ncbi:facilitated trehalose transporter Tret1-like isoform X2 [Epargyreus clarus]
MLGFPAILLPQLREPLSPVSVTTAEESWIASIFALGMITGFFITSPIMDRLGRKKANYFVAVLSIVGWITFTLATDVKAFIAARILHGTAAGLLSTQSTVLLAECTSPRYRGAFLTTITLSQSLGILLVHFLGSLLSWQWTALVCISFPFVSLIMFIYSQESPSWLLSKGRYEEFQKVFRWFRGDVEEEELTSMLRARTMAQKNEETRPNVNMNGFANLKEVIVKKEFYKPIIIMIHSNNLLHFAGGTLIVNYSTIVITLMMGPNVNAYFWTVFMDVLRILSNVIAIFLIHRFKRRTMLFSTGGLCVFCHVVLICYLYGSSKGWFEESLWVPVLFVSLLLFSNAVGIVPIRNVMTGEVFPLRYRSIGGSIGFASGSIVMFIVLKTFPLLTDNLHLYGTYIVYGSVLVYSLLVMWILLPETKGKTLQQIEEEFKGKPNETNVATVELSVK